MLARLSGMNIFKCSVTFFSSEGGNKELELVRGFSQTRNITRQHLLPTQSPYQSTAFRISRVKRKRSSKVAFSSRHAPDVLYI